MQLLATLGSEGGHTEGLDFIPGEVMRLSPDSPQTRIPHIGWNEVHQVKKSASPFWRGCCIPSKVIYSASYQNKFASFQDL